MAAKVNFNPHRTRPAPTQLLLMLLLVTFLSLRAGAVAKNAPASSMTTLADKLLGVKLRPKVRDLLHGVETLFGRPGAAAVTQG